MNLHSKISKMSKNRHNQQAKKGFYRSQQTDDQSIRTYMAITYRGQGLAAKEKSLHEIMAKITQRYAIKMLHSNEYIQQWKQAIQDQEKRKQQD